MKTYLHPITNHLIVLFCSIFFFGSCAQQPKFVKGKSNGDMILWYDKPAVQWLDAMPIGNGMVAGMVFGKPSEERIALNESSFWSGRPHDYNDTNAWQYFEPIKKLVFDGKYQEAEKIIDEKFYGVPVAQQAYQPLGDLKLWFPYVDSTKVTNYRRDLDMETGITSVTYKSGDTTYNREVFVSYPDKVMVVRITSDKQNAITMQAGLESYFKDTVTTRSNSMVLDGTWKGPLPEFWLIGKCEGEGLSFRIMYSAHIDGGTTQGIDNKLDIKKANSVTLILTAATSYEKYDDISGDPAEKCDAIITEAISKDYSTLRQRHIADFQELMGRVHLTVGDTAKDSLPINQRLQTMKNGDEDANLEALCFQFGRYILASSSRKGGQPANLQAIWNEDILPNWGSKYTININTEMNYWPAEVCNLSECHQPLFDMIQDISETGAKTAKIYYGCNGWVAHHNIDLWRGTAPVDGARFGMWPVGGAWLCQHLWEHYAYTQDFLFLKKYYPVMKGSAEFLLDLMVEHPTLGYLVTPFSMSPEHGFIYDNGKLGFVSPSPTMDVAIIRELFPHCIEASKILKTDADFRAKLEEALTKLPPYKVSKKTGYVQEWIEDWVGGNQGHNFSANFPFFPGNSILFNRESDKELVAATNKWMENRKGRRGFPLAWDMCMWARLERGDKVASCITTYVSNSISNNLHNSGSNQSDGTFGYTAGVAEALIQSHAGEISLLPALPSTWKNGSITGLRARGGYEVDMTWNDGKLLSAKITNNKGGTCSIRHGNDIRQVTVNPGKVVTLNFSKK